MRKRALALRPQRADRYEGQTFMDRALEHMTQPPDANTLAERDAMIEYNPMEDFGVESEHATTREQSVPPDIAFYGPHGELSQPHPGFDDVSYAIMRSLLRRGGNI